MLHILIHTLREYGFDAYFIPQNSPPLTNPKWNTPHFSEGCTGGVAEVSEEWVVLYPEGVFGNPLNAKRVARYLLNREAAVGGPGMGAAPEDFLITYQKLFHPTAPVLYYPLFEGEVLIRAGKLDAQRKRTQDAFYVGKGSVYGPCPPISGALEITRNWPESKAALYDMLENVRVFYSYDWLTSTNCDAALLGCEVRLIGNSGPYDAEQLLRKDVELETWDGVDVDGCPFIRAASSGRILNQIQTLKSQFHPRVVEIFGQIAAMV